MKTVATSIDASTDGSREDDISQAYDQHRIRKELKDFYKFTSFIRHGDYNSVYFFQVQEQTQRYDPLPISSQISNSPEISNQDDVRTEGSTMTYENDSGTSKSSIPTVSSTIAASSTSKKDAINPLHSAFLARARCSSAPHAFHIQNMIEDSYKHKEGLNSVNEDEILSTGAYTCETTTSIADLKARKRQIERNFEAAHCTRKNSIVYDGYEFDIPVHRTLTASYF